MFSNNFQSDQMSREIISNILLGDDTVDGSGDSPTASTRNSMNDQPQNGFPPDRRPPVAPSQTTSQASAPHSVLSGQSLHQLNPVPPAHSIGQHMNAPQSVGTERTATFAPAPQNPIQGPQSNWNIAEVLKEKVVLGKISRAEGTAFIAAYANARKMAKENPSLKPSEILTSALTTQFGEPRAKMIIKELAPTQQSQSAATAQSAPMVQRTSQAPTAATEPARGVPMAQLILSRLPDNTTGASQSPPINDAVVASTRVGSERTQEGTKKRRGKATTGTDEAGNPIGRGKNKAGAANGVDVDAPKAAKQVVTSAQSSKMDANLDPVSLTEFSLMNSRDKISGTSSNKVSAKSDLTAVANCVVESVLPSDTIDLEEEHARLERRNIVADAHPSATSGRLVGATTFGGLYSRPNVNYGGASWDSEVVMTKSKILNISAHVLQSDSAAPSMSIDDDAVKLIAYASQALLKEVIEASVTSSRRRRNITAIQHFEKLRNLFCLPGNVKGVATPEHAHNLAMSWTEDVAAKVLADGIDYVNEYEAAYSAMKEELKDELVKFDESSKVTGRKRPSSGAATEITEPWWIKDEKADKAGLLTLEEKAIARFRLRVAKEYELGPSKQNKRVRSGKPDETAEAAQGEDMEIIEDTGNSGVGNGIKSGTAIMNTTSASHASASSSSNSNCQNSDWEPVKCPLQTDEPHIVSKVDVLRNLTKKIRLRSGGYHTERLGTAIFRAQFNIGSQSDQHE